MQYPCASVVFLFAFVLSASAADKAFVITVEAGEFDRRDTTVGFALPEAMKGDSVALQWKGKAVPFQKEKDGRATFLVERLKKGERASYDLTFARTATGPERQVTARRDQDKVKFGFARPGSAVPSLIDYQAEPGAFPRADIKAILRRGG